MQATRRQTDAYFLERTLLADHLAKESPIGPQTDLTCLNGMAKTRAKT